MANTAISFNSRCKTDIHRAEIYNENRKNLLDAISQKNGMSIICCESATKREEVLEREEILRREEVLERGDFEESCVCGKKP